MTEKEKAAIERVFKPTGEVIKNGFNRTWGGHTFTDDEIELLLEGKELKVQTQNDKIIIGRLEKSIYKKHKYWGFNIGIPEKTAGHEWSEDERLALYAGEEILITDFYSTKKCENFEAIAFWDDKSREILLTFEKEE